MLLEQKEKNSTLSSVAVYSYQVFTFHCNMSPNHLYCCKIQYEGNWSNYYRIKGH